MTTFVSDREIYEQVVRDRVPLARQRLWIATADIKDMYVSSGGLDMIPFLEVLSGLVGRGVEVRLIHAKEPGPNFRADFDGILVSSGRALIDPLAEQFDAVWRNAPAAKPSGSPTSEARSLAQQGRKRVRSFCADSGRKDFCLDPIVG